MNTVDIILFVFALALLFYSGGAMVRSLTWIGRYLNLSEYFLSFVLAAFATSLPEFFVGVTSSFQGASILSFGNLVGASVLNLTIVLGVAAFWNGGLSLQNTIKKEEGRITLGLVLFPGFLILDKTISRYDGAVLIFVFLGYILYLLDHEKTAGAKVNQMTPEESGIRNFMKKMSAFCVSAALLLMSSQIVVGESIGFAENLGFSLFFIGILVAIGTTLPELVFSIKSVAMRHSSMSLGNAFGSVIVNMSFILGVVALIHPIQIENLSRALWGISIAAIMLILIRLASFSTNTLSKKFGAFLILIAILFIGIESAL